MQVYKVPYNFRHEEKIFGGYVSLRQGIYLILALFSSGIIFIPNIATIVRFTFAGLMIVFWCLCAFLKIEEINADRYLINVLKYMFREKVFIYRR